MNKRREAAIDTTVVQKASALIGHPPREGSQFVKRLALLEGAIAGRFAILISKKLRAEYGRQVHKPYNDWMTRFLAFLDSPGGPIWNWRKQWSGADREKARRCRYPAEDDHVLRTAIRPSRSEILTEELRMLQADACIYRAFRVHIRNPVA
ncbi:MAG: hypothetical protein HYY17_06145 [Planctomycetes bacterium]|nr:hypothetical protein [Planctomycetota bacterium]